MRSIFEATLIGIVLFTSIAGAEETPTALPFRVAWATRVTKPPVIDGKLVPGDGWDAAPTLTDFTFYLGKGTPTLNEGEEAAPTEARLLYDAQALYIAMRLDGRGRGELDATTTQRDGGVGSDDSVHLFIVPPGAPALGLEPQPGRWYFHLTVNAIGTQRDAVGYKGVSWWNGEWLSKTSIRDDGWDLEMRIPFKTLGMRTPKREAWGINLCRRYSTEHGGRFSNWSPVRTWYSSPERFGRVVFGEGKPREEEISLRFVKRELRKTLSDSQGALARARRDLDAVPDEGQGRDTLLAGLGPLDVRAKALRKKVAGLAPAAAGEAYVNMTKEVDALLSDAHATERAAAAMFLRERTDVGWPFIVLGGPAITNERFEPGVPFPPSFERTDRLSVVACRGEYEPTTFVLYCEEARTGVVVKATDLTGPAGKIAADAVDLHVIKYWFQAGEREGSADVIRAGGVLVPELLLKDDGLVVVDRERRKNFMRTEGGLVDISDPAPEFTAKGKLLVEAPKLLKLAPKDADELKPFDVPPDGIKQVFVTVHVPADAGAGKYDGEIRVDTPGARSLVLPISVEVLPFDLADAPIDYSLYYQGRLADEEPLIPVWSHRKTEEQFRAEMADLLAHGIVNPQVIEPRFEKFVRVMRIREEIGIPKGHIYNWGLRIPRGELDQDEELAKFGDRLRPFVEWAKENGYGDFYVYAIDEADPLLPRQRRWIEAAHDAGAKVFASVEDDAGFFGLAGDILDLPIMSGPVQPHIARRVHRNHHRLGIYAFPQVNWETPETFRRHYGVRLWQAGYDVEMTYAYQHGFGHIWNDFDGAGSHKDYNFAYPTVGGVVDTLCFEGLREAVDDTRYVATLLRAVEEARKNPATRAKADAAEKWIRSVDTQGDVDQLRREIVDRILQLMR